MVLAYLDNYVKIIIFSIQSMYVDFDMHDKIDGLHTVF